MAQTGVIVHRQADTFPPNEFWEKALAENPTAWGAVRVATGDDGTFLEINSGDGLDLETIQGALTEFKDQPMWFYLCNSETAISMKDMSPYILLTKPAEDDPEAEIPLLVGLFDGNFPGFAKEKSSHPPEYHLVADVLMQELDGLFEMADGDIDKLMENLKKPFFNKKMLAYAVGRGTITLVASNGVALNFAQPHETSRDFPDWGWVSNHYGFGDEAKTAKKKPGMFSGGKSTIRERAPSLPPVGTEEVVKPKTTSTAALNDYKGWKIRKEKPPADHSRTQTQEWYKTKIGYFPPGGNEHIAVNVYVSPTGQVMTFSQMNKALGMLAAGLTTLADNPRREAKNTEPVQVSAQVAQTAETEKPVSVVVQPIISPKGREHMNTLRSTEKYKKMIAENAEVIGDPKQFEGYEQRFVDFAKQMGVKDMMEFACWDFDMEYEYAKTQPLGCAVMLDTFKNICIRNGYFKDRDVTGKTVEAPPKKPGMFAKAG